MEFSLFYRLNSSSSGFASGPSQSSGTHLFFQGNLSDTLISLGSPSGDWEKFVSIQIFPKSPLAPGALGLGKHGDPTWGNPPGNKSLLKGSQRGGGPPIGLVFIGAHSIIPGGNKALGGFKRGGHHVGAPALWGDSVPPVFSTTTGGSTLPSKKGADSCCPPRVWNPFPQGGRADGL